MSVHKTNDGRWYVKYYDYAGKAKKFYVGRGDDAKRRAEALDYEIKARKKTGRKLPWEEQREEIIFLDELARRYINDRQGVCSEKYIAELRSILNKIILPEVGHIPVNELTYDDIAKPLLDALRGKSIATRNRRFTYLKALFNWGIKRGYINNNPLKSYTKTKEPKRKVRLTVEDLTRILQHADPHLAWVIEVEWNLGTRPGPSELLSLKWENVDWQNNCVWVYASKTKTWRNIPIGDEFRRRLFEVKERAQTEYIIEYKGKPVKKFRRSLKTACRRAGINYDVRMYDIRHLFASVMLAGGADLAAVSALLGHQSIHTTQQAYYELLKGEKERAVTLLPSLQRENLPQSNIVPISGKPRVSKNR